MWNGMIATYFYYTFLEDTFNFLLCHIAHIRMKFASIFPLYDFFRKEWHTHWIPFHIRFVTIVYKKVCILKPCYNWLTIEISNFFLVKLIIAIVQDCILYYCKYSHNSLKLLEIFIINQLDEKFNSK